MADRSQSVYRAIGLLFPLDPDADPRNRLLASGSYSGEVTYTQAGPFVGTPEPASSNTSRLVLEATGELSSPLSADQEVRVLQGGMPQPAGSAGLGWRYDGATLWHGWDPPCSISGWECPEWTDGTATYTTRETRDPHALGLPSGIVLVAYQRRSVVAGTTYYQVCVKIRAVAGTWSTVTVYSSTTAPTEAYYPCLWRIPAEDEANGGTDGAIFLAFWLEDNRISGSEVANVSIYRSTDSGTSWTRVQKRALRDNLAIGGSPNPYTLGRLRAAYSKGQTMMVAHLRYAAADTFRQLASPDEGFQFDTVATWSGDAGDYQEVLVVNGRFTLFYLTVSTGVSSYRPVYRQTASAYEDLQNDGETAIDPGNTSAPWGDINGGGAYFDTGDLAVVQDWSGYLYAYGRQPNIGGAPTEEECIVFRSRDYGATWESVGLGDSVATTGIGTWWRGRDTGTYPTNFTAAPCGGRMVLMHNWVASPGDEDDSLGALYLGGWSTVTLPDYSATADDTRRVGWEWTWLPYELPSDMGWTATTAGVSTGTLDSDGHLSITATVGARHYYITPDSTPVEGLIVLLEIRVNSGGSLATTVAGAYLDVSDGVNGYSLALRCTTTGFRIYDRLAGAAVGSDATVDMTGWVQILIAFSGDAASAGALTTAYRVVGTGTARTFAVLHSGASITAGAVAADLVDVGLGLSANTTADMDVRVICVSDGAATGLQLSGGQTNPGDLFPGPCSTLPYPTDSGARVFGRRGPAATGDEYTVPTDYEYPIRRLLPEISPSPRNPWRSTSTAEQKIALELDANADQYPPSDTIVLALFGVRQRLAYLEGRTKGTGAWTTLATLDAAQGLSSVPYLRTGSSIVPDTATAGAQHPHLLENDFLGGYVRLDTNKIREIIHHTEGVWQTSSYSGTYTLPVVTLSGVDSGDPTSGTAQIWSPNVCAIVHLCGAKYNAYRIRLPTQEAPNSYFEIGTAFFGWVKVLAHQYGWGRSWEYEDGTQAEDLEDGRTVIYEAAPGRRVVDLPWESIDGEVLWGNSPGPDYVLGSATGGARPLGAPQATAYALEGVYRAARGQAVPVLYLPYVPKGPVSASDAICLTSRQDFWLCRIDGPPKLTNILGDEHSGEMVTAALGLREET